MSGPTYIYIYYVINQQTIIMFSDVSENAAISSCGHFMNILIIPTITHRIHGAGIYANINGVYWWDPCPHIYIYIAAPWILWVIVSVIVIITFTPRSERRGQLNRTSGDGVRFFSAALQNPAI